MVLDILIMIFLYLFCEEGKMILFNFNEIIFKFDNFFVIFKYLFLKEIL